MKICALVDFHGDTEAEYQLIVDTLSFLLTEGDAAKLNLERDIQPHRIPASCDAYVIDYGGLSGMGCDGLVRSMWRSLVQQVQEKPNMLFIIRSTHSYVHEYCYQVEEELGEMREFPNVINIGSADAHDKIKAWFSSDDKQVGAE